MRSYVGREYGINNTWGALKPGGGGSRGVLLLSRGSGVTRSIALKPGGGGSRGILLFDTYLSEHMKLDMKHMSTTVKYNT